jgi:hypothetical protein
MGSWLLLVIVFEVCALDDEREGKKVKSEAGLAQSRF